MSINCGNIHVNKLWEDTLEVINKFMQEKGFSSVVPEEHIPELQGIDYSSPAEKNLRFFIITKNINGWTGIFEDGEINAEIELAEYISEILKARVIWSIFSGSKCNYLYTIFEEGKIVDRLARGDAYDYDEKGQLKYFEFYNEDTMVEFLKKQGITTPVVTYEEVMRNLSGLNLSKDALVHIAFKRIKPIIKEEACNDFPEEDEEEKSGFFQKMMDRLTQPIWGKLEQEIGKVMPQLQKAREMQNLLKPLMEQGLKGEELRAHPDYQKLVALEKEIIEEVRQAPYYSPEMEQMLAGGTFTSKLLKAYDPVEEEVKNLNSSEKENFSLLAESGKKILELLSGIKIDRTEKGIKRIDRAISWSGIPEKADPEKFRLAMGALIGETIMEIFGGEWVKREESPDREIKIKGMMVNPFRWFDEKISTGKKLYFYEEISGLKENTKED